MSEDLFKEASEKAFLRVKEQILKEMSHEDFDWDFLVSLFLKDGTPLIHAFGAKTIQCAELYLAAKKMATIADDLSCDDEESE